MNTLLDRLVAPVYALSRIVLGLLFAVHGAQKVLGLFGGTKSGGAAEMFSQFWVGGVIELAGGLLIAIGLFTRWAAFVASGTMAVAYFQFHQPNGLLPHQNHGELAVVYCFVLLIFATRGDGIWSVGKRKQAAA